MAYTTINKSTDYFNTKLYTGNNSTNAITGIGHQPDLVWIKRRNNTADYILFDSLRGVQKGIFSSRNSAEETENGTRGLNAFNSDGFTLGAEVADIAGSCNGNNDTYAAWNWKAGASQTLNTGNVTSTVKANTTAGFSIVSWTGTAGNILVSHGLGAVPKMIIFRNRSVTQEWAVYHASIGPTKYLELNANAAAGTAANRFNNSSPDATDFIVSSDASVNGSGNSMIAYCFAPKTGYSKFGSYVGNGNADGPFVYMGFKPAMIIYKRASDGTNNWSIFDNKRDPDNQIEKQLNPNLNGAEGTSGRGDFLSNGWKVGGGSSGSVNNAGTTYIYMAFAEAPLVGSNGVTAKAR